MQTFMVPCLLGLEKLVGCGMCRWKTAGSCAGASCPT